MKRPLKDAANTENVNEIMNFTWVPFGQGMWNTPASICGSFNMSVTYTWGKFWQGYDAGKRQCFNQKCGYPASEEADFPGDCYKAENGPYCQHGGAECAVNAIQECAKANNDWVASTKFSVCMEENYEKIQHPNGLNDTTATFEELKGNATQIITSTIANCSARANINPSPIQACFAHNETQMLVQASKRTIDHTVVPVVRVSTNGKDWTSLEPPGEGAPPEPLFKNFLINAVCSQFASTNGLPLNQTKACKVASECAPMTPTDPCFAAFPPGSKPSQLNCTSLGTVSCSGGSCMLMGAAGSDGAHCMSGKPAAEAGLELVA